MKALLSALFKFSLISLGAFSATITLYEVVETSSAAPSASDGASVTISPVGVGADGKTTYIAKQVITEIHEISTTVTLPPKTFTYTFEEDASGLSMQASLANFVGGSTETLPGVEFNQSCNFQGTTAGSCVNIYGFPGDNGTIVTTITTTYSGTLVPIYTLTETSASMPSQTQNSGALTRNDIWSTCQLVGWLFGMWVTLLVAWL